MRILTSAAEVRAEAGAGTRSRAVVMTMGALHEGHSALVRAARREVGPDGTVLVTVFVNPTQFGAGEDFTRYPRTFDADVAICEEAGANLVFAPSAAEVYGPAEGFGADSVTIDPGPLGEILEGAARAGHFRGMLTVVAKLLGITQPDVALFGEKDYQQLVLIRRMVGDLNLPVEVIGVPTVREEDGLARSSRNRYLSADERRAALAIPRALEAAVEAAGQGHESAVRAGRAVLALEPAVEVDYVVMTDPDLGPPPGTGMARVLIAATVGTTRLIDNESAMVRP